ncbi:hypothetical protein BDK51DRAFT_39838 [Blyttiomyces helicus]|uniref:Galactose oxidase n=1 Tax=Blyttiomyces helicus TaxID=388810 RepID=A0A4P9W8V4_9FUNG|nr:hypothetical protein BDK51DRAFT_39838 [Blyttiomyces helicus]|eukprot:RKO88804.1 hypothetical protein BDK51DRAFT_39838 [Blyttiomyces helicus]
MPVNSSSPSPFPLTRFCAAALNDTSFLIYGGAIGDAGVRNVAGGRGAEKLEVVKCGESVEAQRVHHLECVNVKSLLDLTIPLHQLATDSTWTRLTEGPNVRGTAPCTRVTDSARNSDSVWLYGGIDGNNTVWQFSQQKLQWKSYSPAPEAIIPNAGTKLMASKKGLIFIAGSGLTSRDLSFLAFNTTTFQWSTDNTTNTNNATNTTNTPTSTSIALPTSSSSTTSVPWGAIGGGIATAVIVLITLCASLIWRHQRNTNRPPPKHTDFAAYPRDGDSEIPYSLPRAYFEPIAEAAVAAESDDSLAAASPYADASRGFADPHVPGTMPRPTAAFADAPDLGNPPDAESPVAAASEDSSEDEQEPNPVRVDKGKGRAVEPDEPDVPERGMAPTLEKLVAEDLELGGVGPSRSRTVDSQNGAFLVGASAAPFTMHQGKKQNLDGQSAHLRFELSRSPAQTFARKPSPKISPLRISAPLSHKARAKKTKQQERCQQVERRFAPVEAGFYAPSDYGGKGTINVEYSGYTVPILSKDATTRKSFHQFRLASLYATDIQKVEVRKKDPVDPKHRREQDAKLSYGLVGRDIVPEHRKVPSPREDVA